MKNYKNIFRKKINPEKINLQNLHKIILKVVIGFGIIAVLFFIAIKITNKKLSQLSETVSAILEPNIKLIKLKEIAGCLYSAEANVKAFTIKNDTAYLFNYKNYINYLNSRMDTLLWLSAEGKIVDLDQSKSNQNFALKIDTLKELIICRVDLFSQYIELKTGKNSQDVLLHLIQKIKIINPEIKTPKKSFFSRLFSSKKNHKNISDSIQGNIQKTIDQTQQEEKIKEDLELAKEINITQQEYVVMNHIFSLLKNMEEKELTEGIKRIHLASKETNAQISFITNWLTLFGLTLALVFSYFIYLDILRAKRFKEQLLLAKGNTEKLASQYSLSLIEASHDPLVTISSEGKITDMNEATVNITGIARGKLTGTDFFDYFTEPQKAREVYQAVFAKGSVADSLLTIRHKEGKLTDVLFNGSIYKDDKGNVLGAVVVARDIAEQKWAIELRIANKELAFQNDEKEKRAAELIIANKELVFQNELKEKRAAELIIANKELVFQNDEKEKRAAELIIANKELAFQNNEKERRAEEKEKRAEELIIANKELAFQNEEKEKRAAELIIANKELAFQNDEKEKRAAELIIANKELAFQNDEKEKRAAELIIANKELAFQNDEKEKRAAELIIANKELVFQNDEKEKRAAELIIANKELAFQNDEKEKRAAELFIANKELVFQTGEKEKRAAELVIADIELAFQNKEKEKREIANKELEAFSYSLKLASQYSLSLIEASRDPLFTISPEGKITDMNEATVKITEVSREQLIGTDFFNYFTDPDKARAGYQQVFAKGFVADYPLTIRDGKLTDVLVNGSVYKDDSGSVLGVVVVARDITDQKRFENELIEAKSNAERATQKAEESTKLKEAFLANMSHEIRTPMNAIMGFSDILSERKLGVEEKGYVTIIKSAGENLLTIINDILDISKIEAGMMTFEANNFSIKETFKSLNVMLMGKAKEKNLELSFSCDENVPDVLLGDHTRFTQIIINLAGNAIKFTQKGSVQVHAKVLRNENENILMEFSVIDTGIGIPQDQLEQIFERFRQAEYQTTRKFGGTGLGLSIAKQLVELQGGMLTVNSLLNVGSVFSFRIPYKKSSQTQVTSEMIEKKYNMEDMSKLNILLVEDNLLNVKLILSLFSENNLKLQTAENGSVGIEKLKENIFDIILMDMEMPVMNGYEAASIIRKELKNNIPIIAMTAHAMAGEREKCLSFGMNDYISKPINAILLFEKMYDLTHNS